MSSSAFSQVQFGINTQLSYAYTSDILYGRKPDRPNFGIAGVVILPISARWRLEPQLGIVRYLLSVQRYLNGTAPNEKWKLENLTLNTSLLFKRTISDKLTIAGGAQLGWIFRLKNERSISLADGTILYLAKILILVCFFILMSLQ
jgi:hypothetical protein